MPSLKKESVVRFHDSNVTAIAFGIHVSGSYCSSYVDEELLQRGFGLGHSFKSSWFDSILDFVDPTSVVPSVRIPEFNFEFHETLSWA